MLHSPGMRQWCVAFECGEPTKILTRWPGILTTLLQAGNAQTWTEGVLYSLWAISRPAVYLLDVNVCFILRAAMTLRPKLRGSQLLISVAAFAVCGLAGTPEAFAQRLPKATGREPENRSASPRREGHKRPTTPAASRTPAAVESDNFLELGERFRKQNKWRAAEAAYKEAVEVWPGNIDALLELGFLYLDRSKFDEAQQTHSKLRSLNASYAAELLAEISRRKAALAH